MKSKSRTSAPKPKGTVAWKLSPASLISESAKPARRKTARKRGAKLIPVFLIEDNRLLRDGLSSMLSAQGLKVVATARKGAEVLGQVERLKPQMVLVDSALGDRDSLRIVEAIRKQSPTIKIVVMHLLSGQKDVVEFVRAGVSGFIMKDASVSEFVKTIRRVADGESVLPPLMTGPLFSHVADTAVSRAKRAVKAAMRLSAREREVTALIAEGLSNREIADRMRIAAHTVKSHVHSILEKLQLHTRLEVAAYAHTVKGA